jgi:hypothetical protein
MLLNNIVWDYCQICKQQDSAFVRRLTVFLTVQGNRRSFCSLDQVFDCSGECISGHFWSQCLAGFSDKRYRGQLAANNFDLEAMVSARRHNGTANNRLTLAIKVVRPIFVASRDISHSKDHDSCTPITFAIFTLTEGRDIIS